MKVWKRIAIFAIIAVVFQLGVLIYLNNFMLKSFTVFNASAQDNGNKEDNKAGIRMPDNIDSIDVSFDGKYCSYYKDSTLYIVDNETGLRRKVTFDGGQTLNLYRWKESSAQLIIAEQGVINGASTLKIMLYDAQSGKQELLRDLSSIGKSIKVGSIECAGTNDIIVSILQSNGKYDLYYIGDEITKVALNIGKVDDFKYGGKDKSVIYKDKASSKYINSANKKVFELKSAASKLLAVDFQGNVYVADTNKNEVSEIYFKDMNKSNDTWHPIELKQTVDVSQLFISNSGNVYINDLLQGKFINVKDNDTINYEGKLMGVFDNGIITLKDDIVNRIMFDEKNKK